MRISNRIRLLQKERRFSLKFICNSIDISETGMQGILKNNTTSLETLIKLSKFFDVPMTYWFEENETLNMVQEPQLSIEKVEL